MRRRECGWLAVAGVLLAVWSAAARVEAQSRQEGPAEVRCPSVLGVGVETHVPFCDVLIETDPELGIRVVLPPRRGDATLAFDLHNRHTYSRVEEEQGRAYARYLATVAVATLEGEILAEGVVLSEFRSAADLVDRVGGGAGPSGLKAVAPTGTERVQVTVPAGVDTVVVVGRSLDVARADGLERLTASGRPVAVLSRATVSYQPRS